MHVESTLNDPDIDSLIECTAFIVSQKLSRAPPVLPSHPVFEEYPPDERIKQPVKRRATWFGKFVRTPSICSFDMSDIRTGYIVDNPTCEDIRVFMKKVFVLGELMTECIIASLVYIERLETKMGLCITSTNWRTVVFICVILASKICDDNSPINGSWASIFSQFPIQRINAVELAVLNGFSYNVNVPASQYAQCYFRLRAIGSQRGNMKWKNNGKPLDAIVEQRMKDNATKFQRMQKKGIRRISTSPMMQLRIKNPLRSRVRVYPERRRIKSISIEQIVNMSPVQKYSSSTMERRIVDNPWDERNHNPQEEGMRLWCN
eukprot:CAMPEP_0185755584 /NCGR_PEP_ID=MMETSP1174-20130828/14058_1 /TAXON_ID=35687 /ORGANISM="Dictyocha speculum, Strain CCMP1381" /LENGTH=318 /DNA_ID=CAMNT_0028434191 /DNA_START=89 /DNA_END=1045 /DNA_ORIENTATION=+